MDRSVTKMTMEQVYRKRAFDRVNQRASRARKKSRIEELEAEVADLKQKLAESEAQVKTLQSNEEILHQKTQSTQSSAYRLDPTPLSSQAVLPSPPESTGANTTTQEDYSLTSEESVPSSVNLTSNLYQRPTLDIQPSSADHSLGANPIANDIGALALRDANTGLTLGLPLEGHAPLDGMFHYFDNDFPSDLPPEHAFSLAFLDAFPPGLFHSDNISSFTELGLSDLQVTNAIQQWERIPPYLPAMCRLDTVLLELVQSSRQHVQNASVTAISELSEPAFPSISSLLNPADDPEDDSVQSPISNAIAMMYNFCVLLRWLISPTKRNYEALPEYLRPLESQLTIPHPIWIDTVAWPEARDRIMKNMDWSEFPTFRVMGKTISINWTCPQSAIFAESSTKGLKLNPLFEAHIRDIRNWTWGTEVAKKFPFLDCIPTTRNNAGSTGVL